MKILKVYIPDADTIDELILKLSDMDKNDLMYCSAFHIIALNTLMRTSGLEDKEEMNAFLDAIGEGIEKSIDRRKENFS